MRCTRSPACVRFFLLARSSSGLGDRCRYPPRHKMFNRKRQFGIRWLMCVVAVVCACLAGYSWLERQGRPKNVFRSIAGFDLPASAQVLWDSREQPQEGAWTTDFIDVLVFRVDEDDIDAFCSNQPPHKGEWKTGVIPSEFSGTVEQDVWLPDCPDYPDCDQTYLYFTKNFRESQPDDWPVTHGMLIAIHRETGIIKLGCWSY